MSYPSLQLIQTLEEISLNALPALQQIIYDGWLLRLANGCCTKRANSVNCLYRGVQDTYQKILQCEQFYLSQNLIWLR